MRKPETLAIGAEAPDFRLPASTGGEIGLSDFRGKQTVVLYFYPKDMTPGCTIEACSFRDLEQDFADAGAAILGVSPDDLTSHEKFTKKHGLNFPLLYDEGGKVATSYGAFGEKTFMGKKYLGNLRVTYVIGKDGRVTGVWPKVDPEGHAQEVLDAIRQG
ncbi:MAG TPA: thioredoxin-dependent thiol peroxidase [Armatimonadota bacterium]|jgi:peroxiredoxin Q/BCP